MESTTEFEQIRYEQPADRVARIMLARADTRNAQDKQMLYEIDRALNRAMHDDDIRVVIIGADGPHFSSGHHMKDYSKIGEFTPPIMGVGGYDRPGQEGHMAMEQEVFIGFCWRWRNMPKPTIAQVQGKAIAGGLMLVWPFDLIRCLRRRPVLRSGAGFRRQRPRILRARLGTGAPQSQGNAVHRRRHQRPGRQGTRHGQPGWCRETNSKVTPWTWPRGSPASRLFGLKLAKLAVNQSPDAQGMYSAIHSAFGLHHLGHANSRILYEMGVDPTGQDKIRKEAREQIEMGEKRLAGARK